MKRTAPSRRRRGAMLVLIAVMLLGFMVAVAFSVDVAQMHLSRTELRTATDAAAKAAAATLSDTLDRNQAVQRGQQIAAANSVNGDPLVIPAGDFQFGRSQEQNGGRYAFTADQVPLNSVRVLGRRTADSPSGAVPLFFGNILGVSSFEPVANATATYIERDVVLVVDRSGSMAGRKFADLSNAINVFVNTLNNTPVDERVGLASYNDRASEDVQLTANLAEITAAMGAMRVGGFTSISRGMSAGQSIMLSGRSPDFVERTMVVMTDGRHNRGPEPRIVANQLAADNVTIHTITFGGNADLARMREVATIGGGNHYHADNGLQLEQIYREIALTLSTMITE
ncbi:vWA domain-containing protein [Crateriforma conspicua]|uniref:von Willebrand factor type A domain protein n=1 Tax=Crateriforma conspicua TaxID=2527996 RepID=A0A5C6FL23_9PLAN|nr:VWA domain-containing protein [Crateriforma conspicua]TWU62925.1 von Willebrand factor type A domain protein [Crateriforma conspicua]